MYQHTVFWSFWPFYIHFNAFGSVIFLHFCVQNLIFELALELLHLGWQVWGAGVVICSFGYLRFEILDCCDFYFEWFRSGDERRFRVCLEMISGSLGLRSGSYGSLQLQSNQEVQSSLVVRKPQKMYKEKEGLVHWFFKVAPRRKVGMLLLCAISAVVFGWVLYFGKGLDGLFHSFC